MTDDVRKVRRKGGRKRALVIDPDKTALLVATFLATLLMGICFFYQNVHWADVAFRVAVVFLFSYVVTFLLMFFLRRVGARELARTAKGAAQGVEAEKQEGAPAAPEQTEASSRKAGSGR